MAPLDDYLKKPYTIRVVADGGGFVASVEELPGCYGQGATLEEAAASIRDAMAGWLSVALQDGIEIPEPQPPRGNDG